MPPAARKFHTHVERLLCSTISPRLARKTRGRCPVLGEVGVGGIAQGLEGLGEPVRGQRRTASLPLAAGGAWGRRDLDAILAEQRKDGDAGQLQPAAWRPPWRASRGDARQCRPAARPRSSAPARCRLCPRCPGRASQALAASSVGELSTYQEPPAGSTTRPSEDSSCSTSCVLRAMRRAKRSGAPSAQV